MSEVKRSLEHGNDLPASVDRSEKLADGRGRWMRIGDDWVDLRCQYDDHGVQCQARGSIAPTTTGVGPWYCRNHAWVILHDKPQRQPGEDARE